jgi:cytochrome c biogenesis protein CcmG/thiol:disulfide interchange protein DsbE
LGRRILSSVAVLLVAGAIFYIIRHHDVPSGGNATTAAVHGMAPEFTAANIDGQQLDLSAYRGKVVLLDFWATWCVPCRDEIPQFVNFQKKYGDQGLQVVGISMDDGPGPVREFYQKFKMNYPVAMGTAKIGEMYGGVMGLPINFLIDREGRIYSKHIGATDMSVYEKEISTLLQSH